MSLRTTVEVKAAFIKPLAVRALAKIIRLEETGVSFVKFIKADIECIAKVGFDGHDFNLTIPLIVFNSIIERSKEKEPEEQFQPLDYGSKIPPVSLGWKTYKYSYHGRPGLDSIELFAKYGVNLKWSVVINTPIEIMVGYGSTPQKAYEDLLAKNPGRITG